MRLMLSASNSLARKNGIAARSRAVMDVFFLACALALASAQARAAPNPDLSPQCRSVDIASAQSVFGCVGTLRDHGRLVFDRMDRSKCAEFTSSFYRRLGRPTRLEGQPVPSCATVAEVTELVTGKKAMYAECVGYPSPDPAAHMRKCVESFAPAYFGPGFKQRLATCESFRDVYKMALVWANSTHNQRPPQHYVPPSCDSVNEVIADMNGGKSQWAGCTGYDRAHVREHLVACVASNPSEYRQLRDCVSVRNVYEGRLRATHGGLPRDYTVLSCKDAQAALDAVAAYNQKKDAERLAKRHAAEEKRQEAARQRSEEIEVARATIRERQQARHQLPGNCTPRTVGYPEDKYNYPGLLESLASGCAPNLTPHEQLFVAGLGKELTSKCGLPKNVNDRMEVAKFISAALPMGMGGGKYGDPSLSKMMKDQVESQEAFMAGAMAFRNFDKGCKDPRAVAVANSLTKYVKTTASNSPWVDGCEVQYATLYSRDQCQCMANAIRGIDPSIHSKPFSRDSIKRMSSANPLGALQMATRCGVGDY